MDWDTARAAIDALVERADPTAPITIGFLGGEPFLSRALVHACVEYAHAQAARSGLDIRFSVTTNGTLLRPDDLALIRAHPFAVTVSIDGDKEVQNRQRPRAGKVHDSFALLRAAVAPLLADPGRTRIAARATVTRRDLDLSRLFAAILDIGFPEVGFAPLRMNSARGGDVGDALRDSDWPLYLDALTAVARNEIARYRNGSSIRLTNLAVALKQIRHGASSPYLAAPAAAIFRSRRTGAGMRATERSALKILRSATIPDLIMNAGAGLSRSVMSTRRKPAACAGRAICARVAATRRRRLAPNRPVASCVAGLNSVSARIASCRQTATQCDATAWEGSCNEQVRIERA
jgi:hypothetical protein